LIKNSPLYWLNSVTYNKKDKQVAVIHFRELAMKPEILEQAADWIDQETELTAKQKAELGIWLQNPEHEAAYKKMQRVMNSSGLVEAITLSQQEKVNQVTKIKPVVKVNYFQTPLALAASIACIFTFVYMLYPLTNTQPQVEVAAQNIYQTELNTEIAERSSSMLKDGSKVHLNANSMLSVSQTKEQRLASLDKGQVFFDVAPDRNRPFIINAGDSTITVLGTSFDVDRTANYTSISVYEGVVKVKAEEEITLTKGQSIKISSGRIVDFKNQLQDMLPLWRSGWLEVDDGSIVDVVSQLQSYLDKEVVFDAQLTDLRINGRFALDRPEESLMLISNANQLELHYEAQRIVLRPKK
jgi:transmembrane sensor